MVIVVPTLLYRVPSSSPMKIDSLEMAFSRAWPHEVSFIVKGVAGMALNVFRFEFPFLDHLTLIRR